MKISSLPTKTKRYLVIGLGVYILELVVILLAQHLGASSVIAVGLSFWVGLIASFILQKFVTFGDKRVAKRILLSQILAFCALVGFNFGFTLALTHLLSPPIPAVITRSLALGITTLWNFYLYKTQIFKTESRPIY